jgi:hypothetical protein
MSILVVDFSYTKLRSAAWVRFSPFSGVSSTWRNESDERIGSLGVEVES